MNASLRQLERWRPALRVVAATALAWTLIAAFHPEMLIGRQQLTMDFASYYFAAEVASRDQNFYEPRLLEDSRRKNGGAGRVFPYIYPPILAQWMRPLGALDPSRAALLWNHLLILASACIAVSVAFASRRRPHDWVTATALAAFAGLLATVTDNIRGVGQITLVLCLLVALAFLATRNDHDVLGGVLLALAAALKMTPALVAVTWLAERRWKAVLSFCVTLLGIGAVSVAMFGLTPWQQYLQLLQHMSEIGGIPGLAPIATGCFSPTALFLRLGLSTAAAAQLSAAFTCVLLAPPAYLALRPSNRGSAPILLAMCCVVLLASPYTWYHHLVFLWPAYGMVVEECRTQTRSVEPFALLALLATGAFCAVNWPQYYGRLEIEKNAFGLTIPLFGVLALYGLGLWLATRTSMPDSNNVQIASPVAAALETST